MPDRRRSIVLLLGSLWDFTLEPENFTAKVVRRGATAGKGSPSHWQPCPSCDGGSRRDRFGKLEQCEHCKGTGRRRVDDYTGEVVVTDEARDVTLAELIRRDTKHVKCPDCQDLAGNATGVVHGEACRRCNGTGSAPVPGSWLSAPLEGERTGGDAVDALLNAIDHRNELGSYGELDRALADLARANITGRRLVDQVYVHKVVNEDTLVLLAREKLEFAMRYLDYRMPDTIVVPRDVIRNAEERQQALKGQALNGLSRERRDKQIRQWDRQGKPRQWIGQQTGLSDRQLREIINGGSVAA